MDRFAFYTAAGSSTAGDSDVLRSRSRARALRDELKNQGHHAVVEKSGKMLGSEHRVRVQHPTYKDTVAYAHPDDFDDEGKYNPAWIRK